MTVDPESKGGADAHPYLTRVLGSVVLFALVGSPVIDFVAGDWEGYGKAALKGAFMGLIFGLVMVPYEQWLKRRDERKKAAAQANEPS